MPALSAALAELPCGTVLDGELVCLQPVDRGRVRCRFDRLSGFMIGAGPHRPDADGLTIMLVAFDVLALLARTCARCRGSKGGDSSNGSSPRPAECCV